MHVVSVDSDQQLAARYVERAGELDDGAEARVSLGTLKAADLREVHAADLAERLLRQARGYPTLTQVHGEDISRFHPSDAAGAKPKSPEPKTLGRSTAPSPARARLAGHR